MLVVENNSVYEIDEECMRQKMENEQKKIQKKQGKQSKPRKVIREMKA